MTDALAKTPEFTEQEVEHSLRDLGKREIAEETRPNLELVVDKPAEERAAFDVDDSTKGQLDVWMTALDDI